MANRKKELNNMLTKKGKNVSSNLKKVSNKPKDSITKSNTFKKKVTNKNAQSKNKYQNKITGSVVKKNIKKSNVIKKNNSTKKDQIIIKNIKPVVMKTDNKNKFKFIYDKVKLLISKFILKLKQTKIKKHIILLIVSIFLIFTIVFFLRENPAGILHIYKEYSIGDKVILNAKYVWYVIEDSNSSNEKLKLISEKVIDINNDNKINDKDKVQFDKDGNCELNSKDKNNIAYLLDNLGNKSLKYLKGLSKITLLTSKEYIKIRKTLGYDYTWKEGNWLASKSTSTWWINTCNNNKVYAVNPNGSYRLDSAKKKYYLRPVIVLYKSEM